MAKLGYIWTTIAHNCVESFPTHMAHMFSNYKNLKEVKEVIMHTVMPK